MLTRIVSFYQGNIPRSVVAAQAAVFSKFGQRLDQVLTHCGHDEAIDRYIRDSEFDVLIIFDIDCIPLHEEVIPDAIATVANRSCVYGIRQNANDILNSADYIGPAFIAFSRQTFEALGSPSFRSIRGKGDVASELTYRSRRLGRVEIRFINPTDVAIPQWTLEDGTPFGLGTNYENKIFHAFKSNSPLSRRLFLSKAAEVVGHTDWLPAQTDATGLLDETTERCRIPVYVISLRDAESRRRVMTTRLDTARIPFRFVDAIDGRGDRISDEVNGAQILHDRFESQEAAARAASHRLVHRIIAEGDSNMALVLEGDGILPHGFSQLLALAAKFDFDVLKLEGGDHDSRRTAVGRMPGFVIIVRRVPSLGSAAYLIRRSAAARFCALPVLDRTVGAAFDDFRLSLRVLETEPFAVTQDGDHSHYTFRPGPRPPRLEKFARSVRMRIKVLRAHGLRVALALELQRFRMN